MAIRPVTAEDLVASVVARVLAAADDAGADDAGADDAGGDGAGAAEDAGADEGAGAAEGAGAGRWLRVAVDGAPPADPHGLADALVDGVRVGGRHVVRIRADDFLRPASLRFEHGRTNPDAYYEDWLDEGGLRRTVLDPLGPGGSGTVVTSLWNAAIDRASRAPFVRVPAGSVVVLSGSLLLGGGLPIDLAVHLWLSPAALARRIDPRWRWTLPAFDRYEREVDPSAFADIVAKLDHPNRPALVEPDDTRHQ